MSGATCAFEGTNVTHLEATDPDDDHLVFDIVGNAAVLAAGPLLRIVNDGHRRAVVFLNSRLNAVGLVGCDTNSLLQHGTVTAKTTRCLPPCTTLCMLFAF